HVPGLFAGPSDPSASGVRDPASRSRVRRLTSGRRRPPSRPGRAAPVQEEEGKRGGFDMVGRTGRLLATLGVAALAALHAVSASAQSGKDFFDGKTVNYVVATKPGGGYDTNG